MFKKMEYCETADECMERAAKGRYKGCNRKNTVSENIISAPKIRKNYGPI